MQTIGVMGAGAWGTALAQNFASTGKSVTIWARHQELVDSINTHNENKTYLAGVPLSKNIFATTDLETLAQADILVIVTPAQHLRASLKALAPHLTPGKPLVLCAKGFEMATGLLMTQVAAQEVPDATLAVFTGPTFASEIAAGLPSAATLAADDLQTAEMLRDALASRTLRPYITDDVLGAQVGGAVKNVIAIASGIIVGRKLGDSARAALMTRGLAEIARLAAAIGGRRETLMGLCGIGDLMLTASSVQSRNFSLGIQIGEGRTLADILAERKSVTEGVYTAQAIALMAEKFGIDMPISVAVNKCLNEGVEINTLIASLLERPLRPEEA